ncbi:MAG: TolC family protein, partial [Bacteroidota bacterium]
MTRAIKYYFAIFTFIFLASATTAQEDALNLSSALEKALENNYGIIISESQANIAGLNNTWGTAGRYPSVGFDASSSNNMEPINNSSANRLYGSIGMNWTLFDGYRVNITKGKLDKLENLAKGRSAVVVENTIQNVILG